MPLSPEQIRKLDRIQGRRTLYEMAVIRADGAKALVCYTSPPSRRFMWDVICKRSDKILAFSGAAQNGERMAFLGKAKEVKIGNGAIIRLTGRTQRDAIIEGELPYVGSL
jgi:hypothetical protein